MKRLLAVLALTLFATSATAQTINDVQQRPGNTQPWGAVINATGSQDISQYNTSVGSNPTVDAFRFLQGSSASSATPLFTMSTGGMVAGTATGSRQGAGTINAQGYFLNGVAGTGPPSGAAGGDLSGTYPNPILPIVNANVGTFGSATTCITTTQNAKGLTTAISAATCTPAVGSITGLGTGVATALGVNIGSAGAPILFNGAGGTPTSLTGTNITGTAAGLTAGTASAVAVGGITGLGAGCATWLGTPSSANLRGCLTDESGTGSAYFQGGDIGTPSAGNGSNLTALNATQITTGTVPAARTNGHQNGTATNDNAAAGEIGEFLSATQGTPQALTTATALTITSVSLTAGDWEVSGTIGYAYAATTVAQTLITSLSLTTNTLDATLGRLNSFNFGSAGVIPNGGFTMNSPTARFSVSSTTSVFLIAQSSFTTSTATATGFIRARRAR